VLFTFPKQVVIIYKEIAQEQECYEAVQVKKSCTEATLCLPLVAWISSDGDV